MFSPSLVPLSNDCMRCMQVCADHRKRGKRETQERAADVAHEDPGRREVEDKKSTVLMVDSPKAKKKDVQFSQKNLVDPGVAARLRKISELDGSILVFTNTREMAEVLGSRLNLIIPTKVHHSSLSKRHRVGAEKSFKSKNYRALVATSSMELGIDVGSLSTNVVLIDKDHNVIARRYLPTAGKPLEAIQKGLTEIYDEIGEDVEVIGAGTTGSGRYLTGDFIGADTIQNEITAQATAAIDYDPTVDTIFEIGGQDSKYISIENGVVIDFEMNKVCAAGTGSFLEEQAEKLEQHLRTLAYDLGWAEHQFERNV